jgi:hypothetical protein
MVCILENHESETSGTARPCPFSRPAKLDPPSKNRVGGFQKNFSVRARILPSQPVETASDTSAVFTKTASGLPFWPSRDPIEEWGGLNVYGFIYNGPTMYVDYLGYHDVYGSIKGINEALGGGGDCKKKRETSYLYIGKSHENIEVEKRKKEAEREKVLNESYNNAPKETVRRLDGEGLLYEGDCKEGKIELVYRMKAGDRFINVRQRRDCIVVAEVALTKQCLAICENKRVGNNYCCDNPDKQRFWVTISNPIPNTSMKLDCECGCIANCRATTTRLYRPRDRILNSGTVVQIKKMISDEQIID